jgi:methyl-accepting chemotaxis protein
VTSHLSDSEVLEQTAEWLSRLADTIERITERMTDRIATISAEQERQADEIRALSNRIEALTRLQQSHGAALADLTLKPWLPSS